MTCPSPIALSMYADGALPAREAVSLERHAATCTACRARVEALRAESAALRAALLETEDLAPIPRFAPPPRARDFAVLALAVVLIGTFSTAFWATVAAAIPSELTWLSPLKSAELFERAVDLITFIVYEGSAMWTAMLNFLGASLVLAFAAWLAFSAARPRALQGIAASLLALAVAVPSIGHAFEIRRSEDGVTVAAGETIDDTLLALGQTVTIDGTVNGDLLAFGRAVTVRGNVAGNLVTAAQSVTIEGSVGGSVLGAAETLSFSSPRIGRDLYGFANEVSLADIVDVTGNAIAFAESVDVAGRVGRDLKGFAARLTVGGAVEGDFEGHAGTIRVLPSARIGGDVTAHVDSAEDLDMAPGAVVGGTVNTEIVAREERRNRYLTVGYYARQIVRLGAWFLTGLILLWLVPVLREVSLPNAASVLRSGGIGLAAAVTLPVAALLLCVTIVGLPLGLVTFLIGAVGLYVAKIVVAQIVGRALLRDTASPPHFATTLIAGLIVVVVAVNVPFIGWLANLVLTLVGFGILVSLVLARLSRGPALV